MRDACAVEIALVVHEHLSLVDEAPESIRMDDAVAVPLELGPEPRRRLGMASPSTLLIDRGVRRERLVHGLSAARLQGFAQRGIWILAGDHRLADGREEHEADPSGGHLFIDLHLLCKDRRG